MARPFYSVDLRNHGASPHVNGPMDPRVLAEDVIRLMDDYDIDIAMLVGHGLGGDTAMAAALWHGDRVDRFMSVEPLIGTATAEQCSTGLTHVVKAMRTVVLDDIHTRADADTMLAASGIGDQALRRFALQNLVMAGADHGGPRWRVNLDALAEDYTLNGVTLIELGLDGIKSNAAVVFEGDAVFVFGELSDRADVTAHSTALCQLFPASKSTSVVSGHWVHLERPSEFVEEVMKFIDR
jgi:esterase